MSDNNDFIAEIDGDQQSLSLDQVVDALQKAIESNAYESFVDNLGDGESIVIDGTINMVVLTEELNKVLSE
jgi:hypothetical protein